MVSWRRRKMGNLQGNIFRGVLELPNSDDVSLPVLRRILCEGAVVSACLFRDKTRHTDYSDYTDHKDYYSDRYSDRYYDATRCFGDADHPGGC